MSLGSIAEMFDDMPEDMEPDGDVLIAAQEEHTDIRNLPATKPAFPDPAGMGFPPTLPMELAMRDRPPSEICAAYGITQDEYEKMCASPVFLQAVQNSSDLLAKEGYSFRAKAGLQAEELLKTSWQMIHNINTPSAVRSQMIANTVRWAGFDAKVDTPSGGTSFNVQINLGDTLK